MIAVMALIFDIQNKNTYIHGAVDFPESVIRKPFNLLQYKLRHSLFFEYFIIYSYYC